MRRNRPQTSPATSYRPLAHHGGTGSDKEQPQQQQQQQQSQQQHGVPHSASSLIRSFNVETNPTRPMRPSPLTASTIPDMPLDIVDRIRSFPLFISAPDDFLAAIGAHLRPQVHSAHDHILTEGDDAKAMYWLVRGVVAVTSRDGEAVYAELKPGAFFGEIGVLMNIPRTATIIARTKCLLVVLKKEDLQAELPKFPEMEKAIRQEAEERLAILQKKRHEGAAGRGGDGASVVTVQDDQRGGKLAREAAPGEVSTGEVGVIREGATVVNSKKRKSPSPASAMEDLAVGGSALGSGYVSVRKTLKELPLFSKLPADILHFLGLSAQPKSYTPFTDIVRQGNPGNDIFFIVRGEAEVIHEIPNGQRPRGVSRVSSPPHVRPRLKQGQYFGEVASLGLSDGRTATVRSITAVECLIIGGDALDELWRRCPPEIKHQVEETARKRYIKSDADVEMADATAVAGSDGEEGEEEEEEEEDDEDEPRTPEQTVPQATFTTTPSKTTSPTKNEEQTSQPSDPDPYLSVDMENLRNRRRNSLAPPVPTQSDMPAVPASPSSLSLSTTPPVNGIVRTHLDTSSSPIRLLPSAPSPTASEDGPVPSKRARTLPRRPQSSAGVEQKKPALPDDILVAIFQQLDIFEMLRLRAVSSHWRRLLTESPRLCTHVDLSPFNRRVNDWTLTHLLAPFIGARPMEINISNCFHITDEGFRALWRRCGRNVRCWKMRSVWDVSAGQILEMSENAKGLEEVDWSNCRKVGDNLLARVVGWVVPEPPPVSPMSALREAGAKNVVISNSNSARARSQRQKAEQQQQPKPQDGQATQASAAPLPGTVIGCPSLKRLNLSYCKHITDRSMAHLAAHASSRLERLSLTRCTSITDAGFQTWASHRLSKLTHLRLADCTYLTDGSIVALVNAAKNLTHLDLSFCCALSDTATEVVALGLPHLRELRLAFCGSAVGDASLGCVALHLNELRGLSVRGCVRVTGAGIENVLEGCGRLEWLDISQCKNLAGWLVGGGVARWGFDERQGKAAPVVVSAESGSGKPGSVPEARGGMIGPGGVGGGGPNKPSVDRVIVRKSTGSLMRPVIPPRGTSARRRKPVRFVVEKGVGGLR